MPRSHENTRSQKWLALVKDNPCFGVILVIELIALVFVCWLSLKPAYDYTFEANDLTSCDESATLVDGSWLMVPSDADDARDDEGVEADAGTEEDGDVDGAASYDDEESKTVLTTDSFTLAPGAYEITVAYAPEVDADEASAENASASIVLSSAGHENCCSWQDLPLSDNLSSASQRAYVNSLLDIDDCALEVTYSGSTSLSISSIQVHELMGFRLVRLLCLLLVFIVFDLLFLFFYVGKSDRKPTVAVLLVIIAVSSLPLVADFVFYGHDITFHLGRIVCLADEIQAGNFWPSIYSTALNGYGYATPLFYGQIFIYIPALLYIAGMSLTSSYLVLVFIANVATCLITYYCMRKMFDDSRLALVGSALYTLCAYRLTNIFVRAAVGEYVAMCFLPLIVYGFYRIYTAPKGERIRLRQYLPIIIGLTGVFQANVPSTEIVGIFILIFCIIAIKRTLQPRRLLALVKTAVLTILTNLFIIVPFVMSYSMDMRVNNIENHIQGNGAYLMQIFGIFFPGYQNLNVGGAVQNEMPLSIGISITLGLVLFLVCYAWRKKFAKDNVYRLAAYTFLLSILAIFLASTLFPWDSLDEISTRVSDFLSTVQFPWRYLLLASVLGVFCTVASLSLVKRAHPDKPYARYASFAIVGMLVVSTGLFMVEQTTSSPVAKANTGLISIETNETQPDGNGGFVAETTVEEHPYQMKIGNGEYLLDGTDLSLLYFDNLIYNSRQIEVYDYERKSTTATVSLRNTSKRESTVELPLQNYDNYHAYDEETGAEYEITNGDNNRLAVTVPAGYDGTIIVKYEVPAWWVLADVVSAVTVVFIAAALIYERRTRQVAKSSQEADGRDGTRHRASRGEPSRRNPSDRNRRDDSTSDRPNPHRRKREHEPIRRTR